MTGCSHTDRWGDSCLAGRNLQALASRPCHGTGQSQRLIKKTINQKLAKGFSKKHIHPYFISFNLVIEGGQRPTCLCPLPPGLGLQVCTPQPTSHILIVPKVQPGKIKEDKPYPVKAEVGGQISRSGPSLQEAGHQAGECGDQQSGQGQRQQLSWGVGLEHLASSQRLQGPHIVLHVQLLVFVIIHLF